MTDFSTPEQRRQHEIDVDTVRAVLRTEADPSAQSALRRALMMLGADPEPEPGSEWRACVYAAAAHNAQTYGAVPYVRHLTEVRNVVSHYPGCPVSARRAAWLHDTVEDTDVSSEDLRDCFGADVQQMVEYCTNEPGSGRDDVVQKTLFKQCSRNATLDPAVARWARAIKAADRLCNVTRSVVDDDDRRIFRYQEEQIAFALAVKDDHNAFVFAHLDELFASRSPSLRVIHMMANGAAEGVHV